MARTPTGAAVLQHQVTSAITNAVLNELAEQGYGRLSMEAVAKRAGVGKSALYRRWRSKDEMIAAVVTEFSVTRAVEADTGSLRGDLRETMQALIDWLTHPLFSRILPDLVAEDARNPERGRRTRENIGGPRREVGEAMLRRAIARGELPEDLDLEMALDVLAAPIYWRLVVRQAEAEPDYVDRLVEYALRALGAQGG
ncbi:MULTISPECIES: TetR/AcrR family transcriptional regulator [unclassified Amycolatopsis]|uniref:TetR/AcrR family transcriptional regulator n=1 Tax=unclassified Amycolatopsis TaxID=2618356 RepID=UPI002874FB47|nr:MULTISPECIES: TetR/AcrR family transcriptional regulator [unclassified Amycolatopsis]MDS0131902.1 TetR/AcrR family transcriptional regulator [Amycolatopsis sp. 505]MDS0141360.1 TetR/AcrR family transcriptional regulator [Amycolatopsis sp. CM201R]